MADSLEKFTFECIGSNQTDDEIVIADSLRQFGHLISAIEDERDRMVSKVYINVEFVNKRWILVRIKYVICTNFVVLQGDNLQIMVLVVVVVEFQITKWNEV